jgi:tetratricopeptide (TPR) repeat protein
MEPMKHLRLVVAALLGAGSIACTGDAGARAVATPAPPSPVVGEQTTTTGPATVPPPVRATAPAVKPVTLYTTGLGTFTRAISSTNAEAQAFFNQGFQMMYSFAKPEAVASFREAWKRDPTCAICYWGEAWSWGSYLNAPMSPEEAPAAYEAAQKALGLVAHATPVERALIEAITTRYPASFDAARRVEYDRAYADAMQKVAEAYPDDLDVGTLYADALFLLEPRRGSRDATQPSVRRLHAELERILKANIRHPGACHLYVHATESTQVPGLAEPCAEFLGNAIPGASHMNHMPSHTWNEIGRWGDSVRANIQAWHSDLKAAVGEGFAIYPSHNLHMLLYAASMDGQGAIAIQAAKDYAKLTGDSMFHAMTLIRFGRFDEVAAVSARPRADVSAGLWEFSQGYAALRLGDASAARKYLESVRHIAATSKGGFRFHTAPQLLGVVVGILEGEIARTSGDLSGAIAAFERAVELDDALQYDEPEALPFAARHWLGAALLEANRAADAERVYRAELEDHPRNGWSLMGLRLALIAQGKPTTDVDAEFEASWARSDTWIRTSRF